MDGMLLQAFVFLVAAVVAVPLAKRFGLGSVLGYLIAGVAVAPLLVQLGADATEIQHYAEFGVVMMLFLIGLELEPRQLWAMRTRLVGLGGLQIGLTALVVMAGAMVLGQPWSVGLAIGLILALSSTAIVMQSLQERGLTATEGGRASFAVLLAQDIAVIPMLALFPLLALESAGAHGAAEDHAEAGLSLVAGLPGWAVPLVVIAAIAAVIAAGHYLTRPLFRYLSHAHLPEIFTAAALLIVIGIALLMMMVGLSPALGAFLAGVVLANSEYRHQLEADLAPFKGLLLGLFFITVGAGIDFALLLGSLGPVVGLTLAVIAAKVLVLLALARLFGVDGPGRWLFALGMAQAGEFGFVLIAYTAQAGVIPAGLTGTLSLVVALSMLLTPALFIAYDRIAARVAVRPVTGADEIDEQGTVIIAGLGRFGQVVNRALMSAGHKTVVLDHDNDTVSDLRVFGLKGYLGDAARPELLHAAGIATAKALVVAIDDRDRAVEIVRHVTREYPHVRVIARAYDRPHVFRLYAAGARDIVRETFDSAVRAARYTLESLGVHPFEVEKALRVYVRQDRHNLAELAELWDPDLSPLENEAYLGKARELNQRLMAAMQGLRNDYHDRTERGWTPPPKGGRPVAEVDARTGARTGAQTGAQTGAAPEGGASGDATIPETAG
jgi:monovalent cation:proton antiporter-2 (CPA2) family protein